MLQGKIAWITGGGSGIGEAGAIALAEAGATVIVSGRDDTKLGGVVAKISARGNKAEALALDITNRAEVARAGAELIARHGGIHILVNSAGVNLPNRRWKNLTADSFDRIVATNLSGTFYAIEAVLPKMREQRDGCIINVASWAGRFHAYLTGPAYNASKFAVVELTMALNDDEGPNGIRACALCPGEVATPLVAKRPIPPPPEDVARMLKPEDLGRAIRFVADMPPHVAINELVISPAYNRIMVGGPDIVRS
jgi:NAD(P)-dependent dehydrogenase (short-subunit alcohol dehydrogenase family)